MYAEAGLGLVAACGPVKTRHSLSVTEPVSRLPQIYGDASAKLSHMVSPTHLELMLRLQRGREKGWEIMLKLAK